MTVFWRFVRDRRGAGLWWCVAAAGLVLFTVGFYSSIKGQQDVDDLVQDLPAAVQALLGVQDGIPLSSAPGYLHARLFSTLYVLLMVVLGISAGSYAIGGSEEDGTLELLLANPISRTRVILERYGGVVFLMASVMAVFVGALLLSAPVVDALEGVSVGGLVAATLAGAALALLHASLAFAGGSATGRRTPGIALATAVAVSGYLAYGLFTAAEAPAFIRNLTPWEWYLRDNMLADGAAILPIVLPLVVCAVLAGLSVSLFNRRDLH
ncbi:MAG: ABC transporter permease subunit [Tepidiformaceae bacterium]